MTSYLAADPIDDGAGAGDAIGTRRAVPRPVPVHLACSHDAAGAVPAYGRYRMDRIVRTGKKNRNHSSKGTHADESIYVDVHGHRVYRRGSAAAHDAPRNQAHT